MARFYRTASAAPLDYMYRLNTPLMEKVIGVNDQYIGENLQQTAALDNLATSFPYLQQDEQRARDISGGYTNKTEEITKAILKDPANWRKQLSPIRDVSKDLQQNYKTGEIGRIAENFNKYKNVSDYIDKQSEEFGKTGKGISADRARAYKQYFLNSFQGTAYDPKTGKYNQMSAYNPMSNIDIRKQLGEEMDKIKADKNSYKKDEITGDEWYFNTKSNKWEGVTPEKILSIATDRLSNPQLRDYMRQDSTVGLMSGVQFDKNGEIQAPYTYKGVDISPSEKSNIDAIKKNIAKSKDPNLKAQLETNLNNYEQGLKNRKSIQWNDTNPLSDIMRGLVNEYSYSQTDTEDLLKNNAKGATRFSQAQANFRQGRQLGQQAEEFKQKEKAIDDRFKVTSKLAQDRLDLDKYKWDNPHATGVGTKNSKDKTIPVESSVSRLETRSFEDMMTTDENGQKVKALSNAGLSADITKFRNQESDASKQVDSLSKNMESLLGNRSISDLNPIELFSYNQMRVQKESSEGALASIKSDLNQRRKWYEGSVNAVLNNNPAAMKDRDGVMGNPLTPEEIAIYRKYNDDRKGKDKLEQIAKSANVNGFLFEGANSGAYSGKFTQWLSTINDQVPAHSAMRKELTNYFNAKAKIDQRRDNFLDKVRYTPIDTDAIQLGTKDSKDVAQLIFGNTQGLKMFDDAGNRSDNITLEGKGLSWFNPKADNFSATFSGNNNIVDYMAKHNVTPIIEEVGNTTKIGSGNAIVKVSFKDPNNQIPSHPFYIELTPELQKTIATRLSTNKNIDVKSIADNINDDFGNSIRKQLINPNIKQTAGETGMEPAKKTIFISNGNTKIPFEVTTFVGDDGQTHLNITGTKNGVQVPLPGTNSGIPGWFNGTEDFIDYIKKSTQK